MSEIIGHIIFFIVLIVVITAIALRRKWKTLKIAKSLTEFDAGTEIYNFFYVPPAKKIRGLIFKSYFYGVFLFSIIMVTVVTIMMDMPLFLTLIVVIPFFYFRYQAHKKKVGIGKIKHIKDNPLLIFEEDSFKVHREALHNFQGEEVYEELSYPKFLIVRNHQNLYHLSFLQNLDDSELPMNLFFTADQFELIARKLRKRNNCTVLIYGLVQEGSRSRMNRRGRTYWSIFSAVPMQNMNLYKDKLPYEGFIH